MILQFGVSRRKTQDEKRRSEENGRFLLHSIYKMQNIQREYRCKKVTPADQQAYEQLQSILSEMPQWSDGEELRSGMEEVGGRVRFCHFWTDHYSMVQLTEDCNGRFRAAYVLDTDTSPEVRREAARLAQKEFANVCRNRAFRF